MYLIKQKKIYIVTYLGVCIYSYKYAFSKGISMIVTHCEAPDVI